MARAGAPTDGPHACVSRRVRIGVADEVTKIPGTGDEYARLYGALRGARGRFAFRAIAAGLEADSVPTVRGGAQWHAAAVKRCVIDSIRNRSRYGLACETRPFV